MAAGRVFFSNVPWTTQEEEIYILFSNWGEVVDFKPFHKPDGSFKGMGVCTFSTQAAARAAIVNLKDQDVGGRPLWVAEDDGSHANGGGGVGASPASGVKKVHVKQHVAPTRKAAVREARPASPHSLPSGRIFFSNVPFTTTEATLRSVFESVGRIQELNLFQGMQPNGTVGFRGMGHCVYATAAEAQRAITSLRDLDVDGRPIWVAEDTGEGGAATSSTARAPALPSGKGGLGPSWGMSVPVMPFVGASVGGKARGGAAPVAVDEPVQVFFSSVPFSTTEETLMQVFAEAGEVQSIQLFKKHTGESRGMGVVTFTDPAAARYAAKSLREFDVDGRPMWTNIHVDARASPGGTEQHFGGDRVFFSNVPFEVTLETLREFFEEVGKVKTIKLFESKDGSGTSRGMGQCTFEAPSMAAAAVRVLRDRDVGGRPIWVTEDRPSQMQSQGQMYYPPMSAPLAWMPGPAIKGGKGSFGPVAAFGRPASVGITSWMRPGGKRGGKGG